jgi:primosomal protein N'
LLLKAPTVRRLHDVIESSLTALRQSAISRHGVRLMVDVDPVNLL